MNFSAMEISAEMTTLTPDDIFIEEESQCGIKDISMLNLSGYEFPRPQELYKQFTWREYTKIIFYVIILVVALVGNISVILTVLLNRSMRTTINYYLVNLAVADLLICVCCMWVHLVNNITQPLFVLGPFMCKFNGFAQMTCLTSSVLTLSAISCDRFIAIMFPLHVRITKQRTSAVISIIWLVAVSVSVPFLIFNKYFVFQWSDFEETNCGEDWPAQQEWNPILRRCITRYPSKQLYYTFVSLTLFFLPVAIMTTAYALIIWRLWISELPGERNLANINVQHRAKKKVIKMVCVVLFGFVFCWCPMQVTLLYSQFGHSSQENGELPAWFGDFSYFAMYLAYSNSALNPIIYGGFNNNFRQGLCTVLRCSYQRPHFRRPRHMCLMSFSMSPLERQLHLVYCPSSHARNLVLGEVVLPEVTDHDNVRNHGQSFHLQDQWSHKFNQRSRASSLAGFIVPERAVRNNPEGPREEDLMLQHGSPPLSPKH